MPLHIEIFCTEHTVKTFIFLKAIHLEVVNWMEGRNLTEEKQLCEEMLNHLLEDAINFALVTPHSFTTDTGISSMST